VVNSWKWFRIEITIQIISMCSTELCSVNCGEIVVAGAIDNSYTCCQGDLSAQGCQVAEVRCSLATCSLPFKRSDEPVCNVGIFLECGASVGQMPLLTSPLTHRATAGIAQFAITINSNVCPHIRVLNTLMRESYV